VSEPTFTVIHVEASLTDGMTVTLHTNQRPKPDYIAAMLNTSLVRLIVPSPAATGDTTPTNTP
jgi:hypothetical protein